MLRISQCIYLAIIEHRLSANYSPIYTTHDFRFGTNEIGKIYLGIPNSTNLRLIRSPYQT